MRNRAGVQLGFMMTVLGLVGWLPVWLLRTIAHNEPGRAPENSEKEGMEAIASFLTWSWLAWMAVSMALILCGAVLAWSRRSNSRTQPDADHDHPDVR